MSNAKRFFSLKRHPFFGKKVKGLPVYVEFNLWFYVTVPSNSPKRGREYVTFKCSGYEPGDMKRFKDGEAEIFFDVLVIKFPSGEKKYLTIVRHQNKYSYILDVDPATELKYLDFIKRIRKKLWYTTPVENSSFLSRKNAMRYLRWSFTDVRNVPLCPDVSVTVHIPISALYRGEKNAYTVHYSSSLDSFLVQVSPDMSYRRYKNGKVIFTVKLPEGSRKISFIAQGNTCAIKRGRC